MQVFYWLKREVRLSDHACGCCQHRSLTFQARQSSEESNKGGDGGKGRRTLRPRILHLYKYNFYDNRFCNWESIFLAEWTLELNKTVIFPSFIFTYLAHSTQT